MARKKKSLTEQSYDKQLRRIRQFIKRAEKRGYRFEENVIPKKPKRITQASVRRLEKITPKKLYEKSTAISEETGKVVSGTQRRKEEYKERYKTRQQNKQKKIFEKNLKDLFEEQRRKEDDKILKQLQEDRQFQKLFSEGEIIYNRIMDMIDDVKSKALGVGEFLEKFMKDEINRYGRESVLTQLATTPDFIIEMAEQALYYHDQSDPLRMDAILNLEMMISGEIPSFERRAEIEELFDRATNFFGDFYE